MVNTTKENIEIFHKKCAICDHTQFEHMQVKLRDQSRVGSDAPTFEKCKSCDCTEFR